MSNPIIERELLTAVRTPKVLLMQVGPAVVFALLVILRWPTDDQVGLSGAEARGVFRLFAYGLLATLLLLVPAYPATSIVREKIQGTMQLLLNTPLSSWSIYLGKAIGVLGFVFFPLVVSVPAAVACYAMGGISLIDDVVVLYAVLVLVTVQYAALGLLISAKAKSTDGALRMTYTVALAMTVLVLGPHQFVQGKDLPMLVWLSEWLRCLSPIPAVMEIVGHGDAAAHGLVSSSGTVGRFALLALASTVGMIVWAARGLTQTMFDQARPQGVITDERSFLQRTMRRMVYLVDPQRRKTAIGPLTNPVLVKEFRSRRFGRMHWVLRLIALCALVSLLLTYATTTGTFDWGVETIGGVMVVLQVSLIIILTPSLASGLISSEHETGGWTLLRMTPLSSGKIVRGKLLSVVWMLLLILLATLPGYAVMIYIKPVLAQQVGYVMITLVLASLFALVVSAMVSSFFQRTAPASVVAYTVLALTYGGTMMFWLGRDAPFGHAVVESVLTLNPMAAALSVMEVPGFEDYNLVPANWWWVGCISFVCLGVLCVQTWRLTKPQ